MHTTPSASARSHRPRAYTVFGAAFVAGAAAAFGVNSVLDAHLAQSRPQVESESILVALRSLPAGSPVTVWDVGLKDWPKAMVPAAAMRVTDDLDNLVARHPLREGQPVLAVQLTRIDGAEGTTTKTVEVVAAGHRGQIAPERDLWDPAEPATPPRATVALRPAARVEHARPTDPPPPPVATIARTEPVPSASPAPAATTATQPISPPVTAPAIVPEAGTTVADTPDAPVGETLTLPTPTPAATPAAIASVATPTNTISSPEVPALADAGATPAPGQIAAVEQTTTATEPAPVATVDDERTRTATRPHPSSVQFLSVPAPESLEADAAPPQPDEGSTAWVGDAPKPTAAAATSPATKARGGTASASPRSARAPAQTQRQQPQSTRKSPQRGQRTADGRGFRPY